MTDEQTQASTQSRNEIIAFVLGCYLIGDFLWKLLVVAHEYQMRSVQILEIALNLLAVIGLFGLKPSMPKPMFWCALIAGIGLLALRLNGDDGWWTGHLVYTFPPR